MSSIWNYIKDSAKSVWSYFTFKNCVEDLFGLKIIDAPKKAIRMAGGIHHSDMELLNELIRSTQSLESIYQNGIANQKGDNKIESLEKLILYQNEFWQSSVNCIESCNKTYWELQKDAVDKAHDICKQMWKFWCKVTLYNEIIFREWKPMDMDSRKLTILIAISDIEGHRCEHPIKYDPDSQISVDEFIEDDLNGSDSDGEDKKPMASSTPVHGSDSSS